MRGKKEGRKPLQDKTSSPSQVTEETVISLGSWLQNEEQEKQGHMDWVGKDQTTEGFVHHATNPVL